ncbi:MAG: AAA family ATPase [Rhodoblastus sp.]|nr:AAA family ATPase [Rhodoblastus sp.]
MFEAISSSLATNQLLVGGVGTLAFGALMYLLRAVPEKLVDIAGRTLWTKLFVESLSNEYRDIDGFIAQRRLDFFSRSLEIKDGALKTGFGGGFGVYDGVLFKYSKAKADQQIAPFETITVSFLTRDRGVVARFLEDCRPEEHRNSLTVTMYAVGGSAGALRRRKRGLDTVFVDHAIKQRLVERFKWFLGAETWHLSRGIPWKLGIVLHGPPGTGKTSLIHALASDLGFDIKYIKSLHGLGAAFLSGRPTDLFVIEDIDTIAGGLNREENPGDARVPGGSALHEILNSMDGMQTPDGLKFIVTTNHIDKLDPAIVRPGRIDDVIEIGPLSLESARDMFRAFYGRDGIAAYAPRTGAELQRLFSTKSAEEAEAALAAG